MTKQAIRSAFLKKRAALQGRPSLDQRIHERLLAQDFFLRAKTVMTYLSYKSEPDTLALAEKMLACGKTLCAPVCSADGHMESYAFADFSVLAPSAMGILEPPKKSLVLPEDIDLILVPGCAFTLSGHRLGYGGGYYDRYLTRTQGITCGFFYECLQAEFVPEKTDVPLDYIITEQNIYKFT